MISGTDILKGCAMAKTKGNGDEGEDVSDEPTTRFDENRIIKIYQSGKLSHMLGEPVTANPHCLKVYHHAWAAGWWSGQVAKEEDSYG